MVDNQLTCVLQDYDQFSSEPDHQRQASTNQIYPTYWKIGPTLPLQHYIVSQCGINWRTATVCEGFWWGRWSRQKVVVIQDGGLKA